MNRTAPVLLLELLIIHHTSPLAALAGGAAFAGVGSGSNRPPASQSRDITKTRGLPGKLIETFVVREQGARTKNHSRSSNC